MKKFYTYAYLREDGSPYYIGKGNGNRIHSKSKRKNMSEAHKGIKYPNRKSCGPLSEECKRKKSEAMKKWWRKKKEVKANGS